MVAYWVYIIYCDNDSYYTGYTNDLERRYAEHVRGSSKCKYTRSFKPVRLAQCWKILDDKILAMKIERYIKKLTKAEKGQLIQNPKLLCEHYNLKKSSRFHRWVLVE